jgi:hypothetical protein
MAWPERVVLIIVGAVTVLVVEVIGLRLSEGEPRLGVDRATARSRIGDFRPLGCPENDRLASRGACAASQGSDRPIFAVSVGFQLSGQLPPRVMRYLWQNRDRRTDAGP